MALLRYFSVGRRDLNPQNSALFLRFKSDARLELTQNPSLVAEQQIVSAYTWFLNCSARGWGFMKVCTKRYGCLYLRT